MQPILLPIAELKPALPGLGKAVSTKAATPILRCVKISRNHEGWVALTTTDLDSFITMRLEQPQEAKALSLLVPFNQLNQMVKSCARNDTIEVLPGASNKTTILRFPLQGQAGETKAEVPAVAEFPDIPKMKVEPVPLPPEVRRSILEALECASYDPTRFILNGAFIDTSRPKAHYVVGTDGRMLYSSNSFDLPTKESVIIPRHKFLGWSGFNNDGEWQMKMQDGEEQHPWVQLNSRRFRFIGKQPEGTYPNWRQVVPETASNTQIVLDPDSLDSLLNIIQRLPDHDPQFHTIGIEYTPEGLCLLAREPEATEWIKAPLSRYKAKGSAVIVFCDRTRLAKALRFGLNTIEIIDDISPIRFNNGGRSMILMPVRASDPPTPVKSAPNSMAQSEEKPSTPTPKPMPPPAPPPTTEPPAPRNGSTTVEDAIQLTLQLRDVFQDATDKLRGLHSSLRQIQREQKSNAKQFGSLRSTLQTLQSVRF